MITIVPDGKPLEKCTNSNSCSVSAARVLLAHIPLEQRKIEKGRKIFEYYGGVKEVITLCAFVLSEFLPKGGVINTQVSDILNDWYPTDLEVEFRTAGYDGAVIPRMLNRYKNPAGILDLYELATQFGYSCNGFLNVEDFVYLRSKRRFIDIYNPTNLYDAKTLSTDALPVCVDKRHNLWVDADVYGYRCLFVDDLVFDPIIPAGRNENKACNDGEIIDVQGHALFNLYCPPRISEGPYLEDNPLLYVQPFWDHVHKLLPYGNDAEKIIEWCAHIIQKPYEKVRWAPILYSIDQGVGKDTLINFIQGIIGKRYSSTIKPTDLLGTFNEWARSIIIRISEVSDTNEKFNRRKFQEAVKAVISGDDAFVTINEKYGQKYNARNIAHVIITTNNPQDILVTEEDRRYDVFECAMKVAMGISEDDAYNEYFNKLYNWYNHGGRECLYSFLKHYDLANFNVNRPRKTAAKRVMIQESMETFLWIQDVLDLLNDNQGTTGSKVFRQDTFIALAKRMSIQVPQWQGPDTKQVSAFFKGAIGKFGYKKMIDDKGNSRVVVGNGQRTTVYYKNWNPQDFKVTKFDLVTPDMVQDLVNLIAPPESQRYSETYNGVYQPRYTSAIR